MDKNSKDYYLENIKHKIEKLDLKKEQYELQLIKQIKLLERNNETTQKFKFTHDLLYDKYNSLIRLVEKQGIIFEISFSNYTPHQWENLFVVKTSNGYEIRTKLGNILMMLDEKYSKIIQDINKKELHSLIVIRVTEKEALVQLRFI